MPLAPHHRRVQHIDRKDLYVSLEARVQYLHSFLDFSSSDIEALTVGAKYIKALIPGLVNVVYKKLLQYDITARAFKTRSTSYTGPVENGSRDSEYPDDSSSQILYRKLFLRGYLQKLCSDPSKMEFWQYLDKVGMMHVGQGRKHPLHVEYVHIGACLGFIQDTLFEAILSHPRLKLERKIAIVKAMGKVLWIQNDLFAKWYVRDGDEFRGDVQEREIEQEGWVNGRRIVSPEERPTYSPLGSPIEEKGCPFGALTSSLDRSLSVRSAASAASGTSAMSDIPASSLDAPTTPARGQEPRSILRSDDPAKSGAL